LENRKDEISPRMAKLIRGLYEDWCCLDERIETVTAEVEELSRIEPKCQRLMRVPGIGPLISTALVAAIGTGEAFDRGRDLGAWLGLVPRQYSTGGRSILGRISKRGSRYLRMLLVQAARVLLMRPHTWSRFSFGSSLPLRRRFGTLPADWAPTLRNRWFADSAQEGDGFELTVPGGSDPR
jgi:transposase